jgi:hypothetical protein
MAMTDNIDFPRLTPSDDRLPSPEKLIRKPEELTDEQFDLLAAAWVGNALNSESLKEFETLLASFPEKRVHAENFRKIRLTPLNDRWEGKERMIRKSPTAVTVRRTVLITLAAAAVLAGMITLGPSILKQKPAAILQQFHESAVVSEVLVPASSPITVYRSEEAVKTRQGVPVIHEKDLRTHTEIVTEPERILPVTADHHPFVPVLTASADMSGLIPLDLVDIVPVSSPEQEANWILRSISFLAGAITKEKKTVDGYMIANACVNGINDILGWDMELEEVKNKSGEQTKVNFNSSLLSFSAPMNKNQP